MYRWKTQAFLLGLAIGKANSNPLLPKKQSLWSTQGEPEGGFDAAKASFEWLAQCVGANIDNESCLFTKTFDTIVSMSDPSHSDDESFTTRRRFLQDQEGCRPEISEGDLRSITDISRISCGQMSVEYSNQDYEEFYGELWKVFSSNTCWDELCHSPEVMFELIFNQATQCAKVDFDEVDPCIKDQIFSIMFPSPDSYDDDYYYYDDDYNTDDSMSTSNNRVLRSLQEVMNGENTADCVEVNEYELHFFATFVLMEAEGRCAEDGILVSSEHISKASDDLVKLFGSPHCFGDAHACPDDGDSWDDDYAINNTNTDDVDVFDPGHDGGNVDYAMIAIEYIEQCANIELNLDSCVTRNTIDFFMSWGSTALMPMHRSLQHEEPSEKECIVPEIDEAMLNLITFESKQKCLATTGTPISDQEYNNAVEVMSTFIGAQHCWQSLCEEGDNPSRMFMEIVFKEIGVCAQANLDAVDQCVMDEVFDLIFSLSGEESSPEDGLDGIRRKLNRSLANQEIPNTDDDPCSDQRNDAEVYFAVNLLLAGASESCNVSPSQVIIAEAELFKLFSAESCWGKSSSECDHDHGNGYSNHGQAEAMYLEFIQNKAIDTLAQCAQITETTSCVFWRSVEILRFMNSTQHANDSGGTGPLLQNVFQNICTPPAVSNSDITQIAHHAEEYCFEIGLPVESHHRLQAAEDLKKLISQPHCFEDLCSPERRGIFVEEWMDECASVDTRYLTRQTNQWGDHSPHPLDNSKLRCMTEYLIHMQTPPGFEDPWECSLPHVSTDICGFDPTQPSDIVKEAYFYCSGGEVSHSPPPSSSPSPEMSMSFIYNEGDLNSWPDLPDTYFSYSMSYAYGYGRRLAGQDPTTNVSDDATPYIMEMCSLLDNLNIARSRECLKPVCDWGVVGALSFDDSNSNDLETDDDVAWKNIEPSTSPSPPTAMPISTKEPTKEPTNQPTQLPTKQPTKQPSHEPTASPTATQTEALVEVTFEVAMTLTGIESSDLDITSLDSVVSLLEDVIGEMLPEGAKARLLKVGGYSLTRRFLLRLLQESSSVGVDVEFEVIFSQKCEEVDTCDDSKDTLLEEADIFSSDIVAKVEDGSLSDSIVEKANEEGIELLKNVTVSPSSLKVSAPSATVIIKKQNEEDVPDSASGQRLSCFVSALTLIAAAVVNF